MSRWLRVLLCTVAAAFALPCSSQTEDTQRGGTFVEPPPVDPIYLPLGPGEPRTGGSDSAPLSLRLSFDYPLRSSQAPGSGAGPQGARPVSPTLQALVRYEPIADSYWFAQATFMRYLSHARRQAWDPEFTYVFGYEDWHPGTYSFTYSNYTGTRFDPDEARGEHRWNFPFGQWSLGYKDTLPESWEPFFLVGDGDQAMCGANLALTPRYTDRLGNIGREKKMVSAGCRYTRPSGFFAHLTLMAYPEHGRQQPWDPDFTYSFGWFDWRPGSFSIYYSNYSGNRLPWRKRAPGQGSFRNGSVTLSWSAQW